METCDLAEIEKDIEERDRRDMTREIAPLRQAEDADTRRQLRYDQIPGSSRRNYGALPLEEAYMKVELAKTAGFCFGVKRAVDTVYKQIEAQPRQSDLHIRTDHP